MSALKLAFELYQLVRYLITSVLAIAGLTVAAPMQAAEGPELPLIAAPPFVSTVRLIDQTADITVQPAFRFATDGDRIRLTLHLQSDLKEVIEKLSRDLDRTWMTTDCTGDDFQTTNTRIDPDGATLRVATDIDFVRWWSFTNCSQDRNHKVAVDGPVSVDFTFVSRTGVPEVQGRVTEFSAKIEAFGMPAEDARILAEHLLQEQLTRELSKLNESFEPPPEFANLNPTIEYVRFLVTQDGGVLGDLQLNALLTAEQLNEVIQVLTKGAAGEQ